MSEDENYWDKPEFHAIMDAVQKYVASENEEGEQFFTTDFVLVLHCVDMTKPEEGKSNYLTISSARPAHAVHGLLTIGQNYYTALGCHGE